MRNRAIALCLILLASPALAYAYGESAFSEIMEQARAAGIEQGHVKFAYRVDALCRPKVVEFVESEPNGFFDDAVRKHLSGESSFLHHDRPAPVEKLIGVIPLKDQRNAIVRSVRIDPENRRWLRCLILDDQRLRAWINETDELAWDYDEDVDTKDIETSVFTIDFQMKM